MSGCAGVVVYRIAASMVMPNRSQMRRTSPPEAWISCRMRSSRSAWGRTQFPKTEHASTIPTNRQEFRPTVNEDWSNKPLQEKGTQAHCAANEANELRGIERLTLLSSLVFGQKMPEPKGKYVDDLLLEILKSSKSSTVRNMRGLPMRRTVASLIDNPSSLNQSMPRPSRQTIRNRDQRSMKPGPTNSVLSEPNPPDVDRKPQSSSRQ
jgi:hypothetical protein